MEWELVMVEWMRIVCVTGRKASLIVEDYDFYCMVDSSIKVVTICLRV